MAVMKEKNFPAGSAPETMLSAHPPDGDAEPDRRHHLHERRGEGPHQETLRRM